MYLMDEDLKIYDKLHEIVYKEQCIKKERRALRGVKNDDVNKSDSLNN